MDDRRERPGRRSSRRSTSTSWSSRCSCGARQRGLQAFGTDQAFADRSAPLAANQGLYNGFLVAGLVWGLVAADPIGFQVKVFFLACVVVAGLYGAATVSRRILVVQALPAALALAAVVAAANMA